jgi:hypothetical protein
MVANRQSTQMMVNTDDGQSQRARCDDNHGQPLLCQSLSTPPIVAQFLLRVLLGRGRQGWRATIVGSYQWPNRRSASSYVKLSTPDVVPRHEPFPNQ